MRPAKRHSRAALAALALWTGALQGCGPEAAHQLPALHADVTETSVSGISSGAYMAGQFQMAHSSIVAGAAIIAGGPYGCAESVFADMMPGPGAAILNMSKAINGCMLDALSLWGIPNVGLLAERARRLAQERRIDPIQDVTADRIYLFAGSNDHTVVPRIVASAGEFYEKLGIKSEQIKHVTTVPAGHAFVTEDSGVACDLSGKPFVVDCDYDQAGELLAHIYGPLKPKSAAPTGSFIAFDQTPYIRDLSPHGLAERGLVYVPEVCAASATCRVHIAFHGCAQNIDAVGDAFVRDTGFARWADTNGLIVLFPQATANPMNPQACWDWWGFTGHDYLTRDAPQIVAVYRMLERLGAPRSSS